MNTKVEIKVLKLDAAASLPSYAHGGAFGDLCVDLTSPVERTVAAGEVTKISTGLAFEFPPEYGGVIEDRSGLATQGITTLGGIIDPGYRGEIQIVVANLGHEAITFHRGSRIAQLRIVRRIEASFVEVTNITQTERGTSGFGSTGP